MAFIALGSAELYDGTWTATGSMGLERYHHTETLLLSGKVLATGGFNDIYHFLGNADLYDPASGTWTATGFLHEGRQSHTATLLPNGQVLVAGGYNDLGPFNDAQLYDPATGLWTATSSMGTYRYHHTATLLPNGKVLVAGPDSSAELYDSASGTPTPTPTATATQTPTATPTATPGPIQLRGQKKKMNGMNTVRLNWKGATSLSIDVYRNDVLIAATPNAPPFLYTDFTGDTGRAQYTYRVCEAGTQTCSNDLRVRFQE